MKSLFKITVHFLILTIFQNPPNSILSQTHASTNNKQLSVMMNGHLRYSNTCVRQKPLKLTLVVDVERWLSYKGTCHVILYLYKTDNFFHINHYLKSVSKVALLHRFCCIMISYSKSRILSTLFNWILRH